MNDKIREQLFKETQERIVKSFYEQLESNLKVVIHNFLIFLALEKDLDVPTSPGDTAVWIQQFEEWLKEYGE